MVRVKGYNKNNEKNICYEKIWIYLEEISIEVKLYKIELVI